MKKLLLISPVDQDSINVSRVTGFNFAPTGLGYVAALTPTDQWDIELVDENFGRGEGRQADLVAITAMTTSAPRAYQVASHYRARGIPTVMGGIHASMLPDEAAQYVDSIAIGEAESVWRSVLDDFCAGELRARYHGERTSLVGLPRPRNDLYNAKTLKTVQTARGCPMHCEFCSVTVFNGGEYRQRPVDEVINEIELLGTRDVFFLDDNLFGHGKAARDRGIRLLQAMVNRGLNTRWLAATSLNVVEHDDLLKLAQASGCMGLYIGMESIVTQQLQAMGKTRNLEQGVENYADAITKLHKHGIAVIGAFILGLDGDPPDIFDRLIRFVEQSGIDACQFSYCTPLPGTRLWDRIQREGRLLYTNFPDDWRHYSLAEPTYEPHGMTIDQLQAGVRKLYEETTSLFMSSKRALRTFYHTGRPIPALVAFGWNRGFGKGYRELVERREREAEPCIH